MPKTKKKPLLESNYQAGLITRIRQRLNDDCIILKNDPNYLQGIPDLLVIFKDKWAMLEVKTGPKASHQPNQDYYVQLANEWSFASFVYPENEEEVLNELERALQPRREARLHWSK